MKTVARCASPNFNHAQTTTDHLVITLSAPEIDWVEQRPKLAIVPVIDVSGSMGGAKLEYAKKSALKLVEHLKDEDVSGLIIFEDRVHVLVEPGPLSRIRDQLVKAINQLHVMGGTNFCEGMTRSVELVKKLDLPPSYRPRVIMFTDGQPTVGIKDPKAILKMLEEQRGNVTVSAFGYGSIGGDAWGGCDQNFLTEFARTGDGNYAFVQEPDSALAAFGAELGGLLSTYATNITVEIEPLNGHRVADVLSDVDVEDGVGLVRINLPEMLAEENRHLVLEVELKEQKQAFPRAVNAFKVTTAYQTVDQHGKTETHNGEATCQVWFVKPEDVDATIPDDLKEIVALAKLVQAQGKAETLAINGDYQGAQVLFADLAREVDCEPVAAVARNLGANYDSAAAYNSGSGYRNSARLFASRGMGIVSADAGAQADFDLIGSVQRSNSARSAATSAFVGDFQSSSAAPAVDVSVTTHAGEAPQSWASPPSSPAPQSSLSKSRKGW